MLLLSCRNASGSLGEQEMLWEHEPTGSHSLFDFSQTSLRIQLVYCDHQTVDSLCLPLIMLTACTSSVFPLSHRNTMLNLSAHIFFFGQGRARGGGTIH